MAWALFAPQKLKGYQIPRYAFLWLLASIVMVIVPHVGRMPLWLTAMCVLCVAGRVLIHQGRLSSPGRKFKLCVVVAMALLVVAQFGRNVLSTDATVAVLLAGITLKLLEIYKRRDVLMVIYLCYFTVVAEFIYSQSIPVMLYMALCVVVITSALMALHQTQEYQKPLRTFRLAGLILLQSVPLMAILYLAIPRMSPLWAMPMQNNGGSTGLSDTLSPGNIGELTRSAEVAFRVRFNGELPNYSELYWRALTLDQFNGKAWQRSYGEQVQSLSSSANTIESWYQRIGYAGRPVDYNVIMEATNRNWIYTLQMPQMKHDDMQMRRDYQVGIQRRITQRLSYDARSWMEYRVDADISLQSTELVRARLLPRQGNPQAREFAKQLRASVATDREYMQAVLAHFRNEEFFYTLSPTVLGDNPIDEFMFGSREGFCEHYASTFTFLMRAANIPARVVTGYMGGEFNPYDDTLTVRQYDAHAWSEVWFPGEGWIRVDPTAAVAPERVNQGSDSVLQSQDSFLQDEGFSLMRFRDSLLLNNLRLRLEMIDYAWNRFVLNYDEGTQTRLFSVLFGVVTQIKIALVAISALLVVLACSAYLVFRQQPQAAQLPATRYYLRFCNYLAGLGVARQVGETPLQYQQRLVQQFPQWAREIVDITQSYVELVFGGKQADPHQLKEFRTKVKQFRVLN
jgi:protein-glutamine gamma-glutamyltransferase